MRSQDEQLIRPSISGLTPYSPGKPIAEVQRELGLTDIAKPHRFLRRLGPFLGGRVLGFTDIVILPALLRLRRRFLGGRELGLTDIVKLASNENPLGPSPLAVQAMERAVREVRLYPENDAPLLRRALSQKHGLPPEQIIVGRGSDEIIHMIGLAFLNPGEEVIMDEPPFTLYDFTAQLMGAVQARVPMRDFTCDIEAMGQRLGEKTKIIFIANPNNPTGSIVRRSQVEEFMQRLPSGAIAVFDEAYREYADDPEFPDSLEYVRRGANAIVLRTFSKIYALAGLRIGYGTAPPHLAKWLARVREPFNVSSVAQEAALASLRDPDQVARSVKVNREGKEYLSREFERLRLRYVPTQANFMLVDVGRDCREVFRGLLQRGVIVRTCDIFGFPNHIRVTIGTMEQNQRFIQALEQVLQ